MLAEWGWSDVWAYSWPAGLALLAREVGAVLLGMRRVRHSQSMEEAAAAHSAKKDESAYLLEEWKRLTKDRDSKIAKLDKKVEELQQEVDDLKYKYIEVLSHNERLLVREDVYQSALTSAGISLPQFRRISMNDLHPESPEEEVE